LEPPADAVCLLSFELGDDALLVAAGWADERGYRLILNPAPARPLSDDLLPFRPILTPNVTEASMLSGVDDPVGAARSLAHRTSAPVVVSMGEAGALLWADGIASQLAATLVEPVDTTGAGDALNGILAAELAAGAELGGALQTAMVGAALSTTALGARAGLPTREEVAARQLGEST
jgi:ribokinase